MSELSYEQSLIEKNCARDNPAGHSHTEIKELFDAMDPLEATYARDDYAAIATAWEETVTVFAARIRRSSESAWSGPAAETSRQAIADYATDATNLTPALWGLAHRVDNMVAAVLTTKNGMPEVVDDPQSAWNPGDWFDGDGGVSEAEQKAYQHMTLNYVNPAVSVDGQIPVLPLPRNPVVADDGGTPVDTGTGDDGTSPSGSGTPEPETPGAEQPGAQQPAGDDTTAEDDTTAGDEQPSATETASTTPQSTVPSSTGNPSVTPSSTTTGTPSGAPGSPSGPGGPGGTPAPSAPVPGRTVPGSPTPAGVPAATAAARTAAGSPGMRGGTPMMGAPGGARGGSGDDDRERQTPDYLINEENTRELLGDEPRTIAGGVLGADTPAAHPAERPPGS